VGDLVVPHMLIQRLKKAVTAIDYVRNNTKISVPTVQQLFYDHGCRARRNMMAEVADIQKGIIMQKLQFYIAVIILFFIFWSDLLC
jgi:hypothetical protein